MGCWGGGVSAPYPMDPMDLPIIFNHELRREEKEEGEEKERMEEEEEDDEPPRFTS